MPHCSVRAIPLKLSMTERRRTGTPFPVTYTMTGRTSARRPMALDLPVARSIHRSTGSSAASATSSGAETQSVSRSAFDVMACAEGSGGDRRNEITSVHDGFDTSRNEIVRH